MPLDYWIVELSAYALFFTALWEAYKLGLRWVLTVLSGALFGLLVELMFVHLAGGYEYGQFLLMLGDAPVWVACGWAFIIFYSMRASEAFPIAGWSRPFAAAVMATSLDLGLDPVAEGLKWWHWKREHSEFFGVSYDNFVGWLMIVASFVGFNYLFLHLWGEDKRWKQVLGPTLAIPASVLVVGGSQFLWEALYKVVGEGPVFLTLNLVFLALALTSSHLVCPGQRVYPRGVLPVYLSALFMFAAWYGGVFQVHPELYGVFALTTSSTLFWYTIPDGVTVEPGT